MNATYTLNAELNGIEITFDGKPESSILESLKAIGYRWHKVKKLWYAKQNPDTLSLAQSIADGATVSTEPNAPAFPMDTPEANEAYRQAIYAQWSEASGMREYCLKQAKHHIVLLPNGIVFTIEKPKIETHFCFGWSSCGQGPDFKKACTEEDRARKSKEYFIRENMRGFDETLKEIDDRNNTDNPRQCLPILRSCGKEGKNYYTFQNPYWDEIDRAITLDGYYKHPGEFVHSDFRNTDYYIPSEADIAIIREAYQKCRDEHERRVKAYLKRYGLSKLKTWTYWLDD